MEGERRVYGTENNEKEFDVDDSAVEEIYPTRKWTPSLPVCFAEAGVD